jgi:hypothetical protein
MTCLEAGLVREFDSVRRWDRRAWAKSVVADACVRGSEPRHLVPLRRCGATGPREVPQMHGSAQLRR